MDILFDQLIVSVALAVVCAHNKPPFALIFCFYGCCKTGIFGGDILHKILP
jgi:hypothetical protein